MMATTIPKQEQVDLIMIGATGLSYIERLFIGSVAQYIVTHATCDTLIFVNQKIRTDIRPDFILHLIWQFQSLYQTAFCIVCKLTNSNRPCIFSPPANILGVGIPINDSFDPSVPPRTGAIFGIIPTCFIAVSANDTIDISFSMISAILCNIDLAHLL